MESKIVEEKQVEDVESERLFVHQSAEALDAIHYGDCVKTKAVELAYCYSSSVSDMLFSVSDILLSVPDILLLCLTPYFWCPTRCFLFQTYYPLCLIYKLN